MTLSPHRPRFRSPLRGPWLTSVLGLVLLVGLPVVVVTGLLDHVAYGPGQGIPGDVGLLRLPITEFPTDPAWLFRLTQGLHVGLGLVLIPVVLAKLWSVIPRLFARPPVRSIAHLLERGSVLLLVGSILFETVTGVLNIQYDYVFGFSFYTAHYLGAWVFIGALVAHLVLKLPTMVRSLRSRSLRTELRTPLADTRPEEPDGHDGEPGLVPTDPADPTMSRRGALALVGGGSLLVGLLTAGQTIGGPLRDLAVLLPRGRVPEGIPGNDYPVNRTAAAAAIGPEMTGARWRIELTGGPAALRYTRDELLAGVDGLPLHTARLPIACVEGWSTVETWTGVRLRDLAARAGVPRPRSSFVDSLDAGPFGRVTLTAAQTLHEDALLALRVNGHDLSLDHGFPARVIVPSTPGVHCTKWVRSIDFREA
ncbi:MULTISPECIES: molybdopterin-dependent oxidoreductase [unclassified Pseudonocardia]|uniref:molybdopterin-dependent oxidoreductase n=1 Tax=unclassified Pseudonocardia TaxID=2619320 RepID=UPI0001FFDC32|nr:molybdopterin-dependent oxidoreductase [Pseudonocardia sp. Ae707_Ps1]OLM18618.1 putative CONSERVED TRANSMEMBRANE PROTEIN [Pseudonocardia sp. Ae707_Ps1]